MASSPFSISKLAGACVLIIILMAFFLPMVGYAFAPAGTTSSTNVICSGGTFNQSLNPNVSYQYGAATCTDQNIFGSNYSGGKASTLGAVFSIVNSTAFPSNTATSNSVSGGGIGCVGGFSSPILQFTGLAFVFCGIGTVASVVQQLGSVFSLAIGTWLTWLPFSEGIAIGYIIKIVVAYIAFRILLQLIASWMKYNFVDT